MRYWNIDLTIAVVIAAMMVCLWLTPNLYPIIAVLAVIVGVVGYLISRRRSGTTKRR